MKHIWTAIIIFVAWLIAIAVVLVQSDTYTLEQATFSIALILALCGYIYQSGENTRIQDLQYRRETYAHLMEKLSIFKIAGGKTNQDMRSLTEVYFRSWAETSDRVNKLLLEYFKAYATWVTLNNQKDADANDVGAAREKEVSKFDELTAQIKKEIAQSSTSKFESFYFQLREDD